MKKRIRADEAFEQALNGDLADASAQVTQLAKLAQALTPSEQPSMGPDPRFRARLRNEMLAAAAQHASEEEELFAALLDGDVIEAPAEMRQLVKVAAAMEAPSKPLPDPAFRYQLRNRLIATATPSPSIMVRAADALVSWNTRMRRNLRIVGATGLAVMMMLGAGASLAASRDALPGDFLYGVKRFQESARLVGASGAARGEKMLGLARVRLGEVNGLLERGTQDATLFVGTLNDMDEATLEGRDLLLDEYRRTKTVGTLQSLEAFAREQAADLGVIVDRLPPAARPVARDSLTLVGSIAKQTQEALTLACSVCPDGTVDLSDAAADATADDVRAECACERTFNPQYVDDGSSDTDGDGSPSKDEPKPGNNNGGNGGTDDPEGRVDLPNLPDGSDEPIEDLIDELVDEIELISPTPLPSLPSLPPVPGL